MSISEIQLFQILKAKLGEQEVLATKEDLANVHKSIYIVGLVQFLAIVGSVLAIVTFTVR